MLIENTKSKVELISQEDIGEGVIKIIMQIGDAQFKRLWHKSNLYGIDWTYADGSVMSSIPSQQKDIEDILEAIFQKRFCTNTIEPK